MIKKKKKNRFSMLIVFIVRIFYILRASLFFFSIFASIIQINLSEFVIIFVVFYINLFIYFLLDYSLNKNDPTKENERQMISNMKDFIQLYRSLREKKDQLTKCNEELLKNDSELKQLAKDIEKQAINALHMN